MKKDKIIIFVLLLLFGTVFYLFNSVVPYYSDDWWYTFIHERGSYPVRRIESFCDIVESQCNHYVVVNGRSLVTGLVQLVVTFCSKELFNIFNTFFYLLLIVLMVRYAVPRQAWLNPTIWIVAVACLFFMIPCHYDSMMWATGSINYLWVANILLLYCFLWRYLVCHSVKRVWYPLLFGVGVLCGWSHEGFTTGLVIGLGADLLLFHRRSVSLRITYAGFVAGFLALVSSPGSWSRLEVSSNRGVLWDRIFTLNYLAYIVLPILLLVALCWCYWRYRAIARRCVLRLLPMLVATVVSMGFAIVTDNGEHRAFWAASFFALLPLLYLFTEVVLCKTERHKYLLATITGILLFGAQIALYIEHDRVEEQHRGLIESYRERTDGFVVFDMYKPRYYAIPYVIDMKMEFTHGYTPKHMAAYYEKPLLQWIPRTLQKALVMPETFFVEENRVPGTAGLYTTPQLDVFVWHPSCEPLEILSYTYAPVSWRDDVPFMSRLRRLLFPASYPAKSTRPSYYFECQLPDGSCYALVAKSEYFKVTQIDCP